jgi:hypothetical protein
MAGSFECVNEPSLSIKGWELFDFLLAYKLRIFSMRLDIEFNNATTLYYFVYSILRIYQ